MKKFDNALKIIAKSSLIIFIGLLASKILLFAYRAIIARYFGPETYGLFSLSFMILGWFVAFSSLGLTEGVLRYVSFYRGKKDKNRINYIIKTTLSIVSITGILSGILLFFLSNFIAIQIFHNSNLAIFLKYFSIAVPIWIIANAFLSVLRAYEKVFWYSFILNVLESIVKFGILAFLILIGIKTDAIIFSTILGLTSMLIAAYLVCKYKLKVFGQYNLKKQAKKQLINEVLSYSWPLMFLLFVDLTFQWTDSFFLGLFKSAFEVGIYNAAVPLALLLNFTADIFIILFFPLISKEFSKNNLSLIANLSKQVGKWIFILNLPVLIVFAIFPEAIINTFFGHDYLLASNALRFLSIGIFVSTIFRPSKFIMAAIGKSKLMLIYTLIAFLVSIVLNLLLIPKYGINGAAISTATSFIVLSLLFLFGAKHHTGIVPIKKEIAKIIFVSLIPAIALLLINKFIFTSLLSLALQVLFFFLLYFFLIILTGCLDKHDLMIINSIKNKVLNKNRQI